MQKGKKGRNEWKV
jgi:hypothetical protein